MSDQSFPNRVVRVFISSTFRDMQEEREILIKHVFPQLRKRCEERGVTFTDVDLRWGIIREQAERGEVLAICLAEIERCPYFIGLLGERYGVPQGISEELIQQQPWLEEHRMLSVTELEFLHGALREPAMADQAFFYFRDPAYVDRLPEERRAEFVEYDPVACKKLGVLKERIRQSTVANREGYPDPETLGQWVLEDLTIAIDQQFPESKPDPLDREAAKHEAFARARTAMYIGRHKYFDRLDAHADGDNPPLVVRGDSGSGKSALLANWAERRRAAHPDDLLVMHFVGATRHSADLPAMLRRIVSELQRRFGIRQEIPDTPDELRSVFPRCLNMAAARGRVVLIIDALNQLEDRYGAPDLVWLPPEIPANLRLIVSTLPGRPLEEVERRKWPTLHVQPLEPDERRRLIRCYFTQYAKKLTSAQLDRITDAEQTDNPLYLRALLEELRVFGAHQELDDRIDHYLAAHSVPHLYEKILARWEADYDRDRVNLVRDTMTALWASRHGLSETELFDLLGTPDQPLPRISWSTLRLVAESSLIDRSGMIGFFHAYLRDAVRHRYLANESDQDVAHLQLADFFHTQGSPDRQMDEVPWQLAAAKEWHRLYDYLTPPLGLHFMWERDQYEVKERWSQVESNSDLRLADAYQPVINDPARYIFCVREVADLLAYTGQVAEAAPLRAFLVDYFRAKREPQALAASLGDRGADLRRAGDLDEAMVLHREQEAIYRALRNMEGIANSLDSRAAIARDRGDRTEAITLLEEEEQMRRKVDDRDGLATCLINQGVTLKELGHLDRAMACLKKAEQLCRELGNKDKLIGALKRQADILYTWRRWRGATDLYERAEALCRQLGNKHVLSECLDRRGLIRQFTGDLDGAMTLHQEAQRISRQLNDKDGLQRSLGNQAIALQHQGAIERAMALYEEQEQLCRDVGNKQGIANSLGNRASILLARREVARAMALLREQEKLCRELGNEEGQANAIGNQVLAHKARGEPEAAVAASDSELVLRRGFPNPEGLAMALANRAWILAEDLHRYAKALPLAEESRRLAIAHNLTCAPQVGALLDSIRSSLGRVRSS